MTRLRFPFRAVPAALLLALATLAPAAPARAQAQTPLTPEEFEAHTEGRTLTFSANGTAYGVEQYSPGRRVRWSFIDGECREGRWYPQDDQICFVYEDGTGPQCWLFYGGTGGLRARVAGDAEGLVLYETRASDDPLICPGPKVGV